jgi:hypothetical protein
MIKDREQRLLTAAEREARKSFRQVEAKKAMTEHETAQEAFTKNFERLKAERLAREATLVPEPATKTKKQAVKAQKKTAPA